MKAKLATINLESTDPGRARQFYVDVLGMLEDVDRSHAPHFFYLRSEGCDLTIAVPPDRLKTAPCRAIELGFEVEDLPAAKAHLSANGVKDFREESMGWGQAVELSDSDGHRVLIYSFKKTGDPDNR